MIHIRLTNEHFVDLELEVHAFDPEDRFVRYIQDWLECKPIYSKTNGLVMQVQPTELPEFKSKLCQQEYFEHFVMAHYGIQVWSTIQCILGGCNVHH